MGDFNSPVQLESISVEVVKESDVSHKSCREEAVTNEACHLINEAFATFLPSDSLRAEVFNELHTPIDLLFDLFHVRLDLLNLSDKVSVFILQTLNTMLKSYNFVI